MWPFDKVNTFVSFSEKFRSLGFVGVTESLYYEPSFYHWYEKKWCGRYRNCFMKNNFLYVNLTKCVYILILLTINLKKWTFYFHSGNISSPWRKLSNKRIFNRCDLQVTLDLSKFKGPLKNFERSSGSRDRR